MQSILKKRYSLVIPVYKNEGSIPDLLAALVAMNQELENRLEVLFVIDGSPDASYAKLHDLLPATGLYAKLVLLSRNFGSFAAIREGLTLAQGEFAAVMAADLQEPPELIARFFAALEKGDTDVVFGLREARHDPFMTRLSAHAFWWIYRRFVQRDVPVGGVDVFAVNRTFLLRLIALEEANSSLLGLLFWMGGRRTFIPYTRRERAHGKSAWTLKKKVTYLLDSVFAFTDAPIRILLFSGMLGLGISVLFGLAVIAAKVLGEVPVPGYAGTMLAVLFFGGLNALGLGLVGNYAWRAYDNTKRRPLSIATFIEEYPHNPGASDQ